MSANCILIFKKFFMIVLKIRVEYVLCCILSGMGEVAIPKKAYIIILQLQLYLEYH